MSSLTRIPGLGQSTLELLEAAGFQSVEAVALAEPSALLRELQMANQVLHISEGAPSPDEVDELIRAARATEVAQPAAVNGAPASSAVPIDHERNPEVQRMLAAAPFAIPLPSRVLRDRGVSVGDIPAGILLNRYSGDLDVRAPVTKPVSATKPVPVVLPAPVVQDTPVRSILPAGTHASESAPRPASGAPQPSLTVVQLAENTAPKQGLDLNKVRTFEEAVADSFKLPDEVVAAQKPTAAAPANDRVSLLRTPREETNRGRDPKSRRYIRGVLHSQPVKIYLGALTTLPMLLLFPVSLLAAVMLLASDLMPLWFGWVPGWWIVLPVSLPVFGLLWLTTAVGGICRVCGQKLFVHRGHLKNPRAHHIRFLGYVLPLCIHILLFRWFRCSHCGTPIRLKE